MFSRALLVCALAGVVVARDARAAEPIRVHVQGGVLVGNADSGVATYKGVPYAAPPVGPLRGALPRPFPSWSGERAADDFGFSCPQRSTPRNVPPGSRALQLNEDCLTLNVW